MKRIGILVVAYNASSTLASVLDRIPPDFAPRVSQVLVCDNASPDSTYLVGLGYKQVSDALPLTVIRQPRNLGYGGNQKTGYEWAIEQDLDIIVLLHADGQYAPEFLPQIVAPLERDECDAVFGSRMMKRGDALRGGMPLYKYVGNHILTTFENAVVGTSLTEWHSGYRAYSVSTLRDIPFTELSDEYDFDTGIILQLHEAGKRIMELPIPTYYGDEISYVNGMRYAKDIVADVLRYRADKMGIGSGEMAFATPVEELATSSDAVGAQVLAWLHGRSSGRVLDLHCGDGSVGAQLRSEGHEVTGLEIEKREGIGARLDHFVEADLDAGIPDEVGGGFDVVIAADALERVREPGRLLDDIKSRLAGEGRLIVGISNFGHWYPRTRVAFGRFGYDRRGILERGHLRFFTARSFERLVAEHGFSVRRREATGLPSDQDRARPPRPVVRRLSRMATNGWPSMFGYELLYELEPIPGDA